MEDSSLSSWGQLISTIGFPIVITLIFALRLDSTLRAFTAVINKLIVVLVDRGIIDAKDLNGEKK